jgi:hypothetical protein
MYSSFCASAADTSIFIETTIIASTIFYGVFLLWITWLQSWLTNQ